MHPEIKDDFHVNSSRKSYLKTILDKEILYSKYRSDIAIIDNISMTNMYDLPFETILVIDQENHSQMLGYSILPNKSKDSFEKFFNDFVEFGGKTFRIVIVDRNEAQYNSITEIFPQSYIVFWLLEYDQSSIF